jgi:DNA-binding transcriptional LysR family regulator
VRTSELYRERYVLITRAEEPLKSLDSITWAEAARLPLCLLNPSMQNRRILDAYFHLVGTEVQPRAGRPVSASPGVQSSIKV